MKRFIRICLVGITSGMAANGILAAFSSKPIGMANPLWWAITIILIVLFAWENADNV
jgi:hypothetical protein